MAPNVNDDYLQIREHSKMCRNREKEFTESYGNVKHLIRFAREIETKICQEYKQTEEYYEKYLSSHKLYLKSLTENEDIVREEESASILGSRMSDLKACVNNLSELRDDETRDILSTTWSCKSFETMKSTSSTTIIERELDSLKHRLGMLEDQVRFLKVEGDRSRDVHVQVNPSKPKIPTFTGDLDEFALFVITFDTFIGDSSMDDPTKLNLLIQHCDGVAKESIQHYVLMNNRCGYSEARKMLKRRLGDSLVISHKMISNLVDGLDIKPHDHEALQNLSVDMHQCSLTLNNLGVSQHLDNCQVLLKVMQRLPPKMQQCWTEIAQDITENYREPDFSDLVKFVDRMCQATSNLYGRSISDVLPTAERQSATCAYCRTSGHELDCCERFGRSAIAERRRFMFITNRCYNCLQPGHIARGCLSRVRCRTCSGRHNHWFHPKPSSNFYEHG